MDSIDIINALRNAGFDTPEKVGELFSNLGKQLELKRLEIESDRLNAQRIEVMKPIEDKRIELENRRRELAASLSAPV
jgi:hypothetical protein